MPRFKKVFKKYERHFLLGIVILLLASFSVTGAFSCENRGGHRSAEMGGEFLTAPGQREEISDDEFDRRFARHQLFRNAMPLTSSEFMGLLGYKWGVDEQDMWAHMLLLQAAKAAGYDVGPHQLRAAVTQLVDQANGELPFSDINYKQYLRQGFNGTQADFEDAVREIVLKDLFLYPLVTSTRYRVAYRQAYEAWRGSRERVDLRYVALPAAAFEDRAHRQEVTRRAVGEQHRRLEQVTAAAAAVGRVHARLDAHKEAQGSWPEALAGLGSAAEPFQVRDDAWGNALRYQVDGETVDLRSAGPDGTFDTPDDVTRETQRLIKTHSGLLELAEKLGQRHKADGSWPSSLEALKTSADAERLPPMVEDVKDGWERDFEYEAGGGETPASLTSAGTDGELGTADDVRLVLDPDVARVTPRGSLAVYVDPTVRDAWDRRLVVTLTRAQPPMWQVLSAGADGEEGTEDDLTTGNEREIKAYFESIRSEFSLPARRRFEVLFVHLPLVSDAALARLWEAYPQHRPTDEERIYEYWRSYKGEDFFYRAEDPRDPQKGHGAELVARIAAAAKPTLVPAAAIFPKTLGSETDDPKDGDDKDPKDGAPKDEAPKDEAPKDEDPEGADASEEDSEDRTSFREKGWREIVIRELFMENLLNDLLQRCRTSAQVRSQAERKLEAWREARTKFEASLAAWEQANAGKPEEQRTPKPEAPAGEEPQLPAETTFQSLLEGELADAIPSGDADTPPAIQYWATPQLMAREDYEKNENFGDGLQFELTRLKVDGEYNGIPAQLHRRLTKMLVRRLEFKDAEPQAYEDVVDDVFERFVGKRSMDLAAGLLEKLRKDVQANTDALTEDIDPAAIAGALTTALEAWSGQTEGAHVVETTGMFIGSVPPPPVEIEESTADATKAAQARRNFIWRAGYREIPPADAAPNVEARRLGLLGRRVLRDPFVEERGSGHAYLVQVAQHAYPSEAEFSPQRYTEYLGDAVFGKRASRFRPAALEDRDGAIFKALHRYTQDIDWLKATFELQTHSEFTPRKEGRKRR